jgi:hypothetical protein
VRVAVLAIAIACVVATAEASADEPSATELATARALFDQGLTLEDKSDWAGALVLFKKVAAVRTTPQVRFHLGLCLENTGKLVEALNEFRRSLADATNDPTPSAQVVVANAGKHISDLESRIPRLLVRAPEGSTLQLDGGPLAASLIGAPMLVDPGKHTVTATASGQKPFETSVDLAEKSGTREIEVKFEPVVAPPESPAPQPQPETSKRSPWPYVTGAVAVSSFAAATVFYLLRASTMSELDGQCNAARNGCPPDKQDVASHGRTYTTLGNVFLGVGAAFTGATIVLFAVRPSEPRTATVAVTGGSSSLGLTMMGRF